MQTHASHFSIREARTLIAGLSKPNPRIYWTDFLLSTLSGNLTLAGLTNMNRSQAVWFQNDLTYWCLAICLFAATAVLFMRSILFIHELVHLPNNQFRGFRIAWNLLCGIPMLIPSFLYYPHIDHHRRKHYGTEKDGEYIDLSHRHPANLFLFLLSSFVVPIAAVARFGLMTPISWMIPGFRGWVEKRASSMIIDIFYIRGDFSPSARRIMYLQEMACFLWCWAWAIALASDLLAPRSLWIAYGLGVTLIAMNNIRTLGAHRWIGDGHELSLEEQLLDSVNYPDRAWLNELWGPIGMRYHALHHLFPSLPYHNLAEAHRRLMAGLPADSIYRQTNRSSLLVAIWELWQRASLSGRIDHLHDHQQQRQAA